MPTKVTQNELETFEEKAGRGRTSKTTVFIEEIQKGGVFAIDVSENGEMSKTTVYKLLREMDTAFYLNAVNPEGNDVILVSKSPFKGSKRYKHNPRAE